MWYFGNAPFKVGLKFERFGWSYAVGVYFVYDAPAVHGMLLSVASIDFYHMYWERGNPRVILQATPAIPFKVGPFPPYFQKSKSQKKAPCRRITESCGPRWFWWVKVGTTLRNDETFFRENVFLRTSFARKRHDPPHQPGLFPCLADSR